MTQCFPLVQGSLWAAARPDQHPCVNSYESHAFYVPSAKLKHACYTQVNVATGSQDKPAYTRGAHAMLAAARWGFPHADSDPPPPSL